MPPAVWAMGLASMFMDISSESIHSLLPVFMATTLGASMAAIGVIEGIAEATAAITKIFSGAISDHFRRRKPLMLAGYGLAALTKPIFPLAQSIAWVFGARFVDRVGKGIRGAPRDALVADVAPRELRGAAYGLRQTLDSVGALVGPLVAFLFMIWLAGDIRGVMWISVLPAFIAVLLLAVYVREPEPKREGRDARPIPRLAGMRELPLRYWLVVALGAVFTLARFSEAFLVLRAQSVGLAIGAVPLVMIVMNLFYSLFAYPAGAAADRFSARTLLLAGLLLLVGSDILLTFAEAPLATFAGAALWGLHMALTQGPLAKLVADTSQPELRGTAFGFFNLVSGLALLLASVIAGVLWNAFGASAPFIAGAVFAGIAAAGLFLYRMKPQSALP